MRNFWARNAALKIHEKWSANGWWIKIDSIAAAEGSCMKYETWICHNKVINFHYYLGSAALLFSYTIMRTENDKNITLKFMKSVDFIISFPGWNSMNCVICWMLNANAIRTFWEKEPTKLVMKLRGWKMNDEQYY